jgi:hypothetical protein
MWRMLTLQYYFMMDGDSTTATAMPTMDGTQAGIVINLTNSVQTQTTSMYVTQVNGTNICTFINNDIVGCAAFAFEMSHYYNLEIVLDEASNINVAVSDTVYLSHSLTSMLPINAMIDSVALKNVRISTHAKYLYINGQSASLMATAAPTFEPSTKPTAEPIEPDNLWIVITSVCGAVVVCACALVIVSAVIYKKRRFAENRKQPSTEDTAAIHLRVVQAKPGKNDEHSSSSEERYQNQPANTDATVALNATVDASDNEHV